MKLYDSYADQANGRASVAPLAKLIGTSDTPTTRLLLGWIEVWESHFAKALRANGVLEGGARGFAAACAHDELDEAVYYANAARVEIIATAWRQRELDRKTLIAIVDIRYPILIVGDPSAWQEPNRLTSA